VSMQNNPPPSLDSQASGLQLVLLQLDSALASATNERELLLPVAAALQQLDPKSLQLSDACFGSDGGICAVEPSAIWRAGQAQAVSPVQRRQQALAELSWPEAWSDAPREPLFVNEPAELAGWQSRLELAPFEMLGALVLLPLYSTAHARWQGMLAICLARPISPSAMEGLMLSCVQRALAAALGHLRAERATRQVLSDVGQHSALIDELSAAATLEATLESAVLPLISRGATAAFLVDLGLAHPGDPPRARIAAGFDLDGPLLEAEVGAVCDPESLLLSVYWRAAPGEPVAIEQIATDPRLDEPTRQRLIANGRGALVVLPLRSQDRLIGAMFCLWSTPQRFAEREQRLFRAISRAAATPIENRMLMSQMTERMRHDSQQRVLFQTTLDLLPVGVWIGPAGAAPVFANRLAQEFLPEDSSPSQHPASLRQLLGSQVLADGQVYTSKQTLIRRDGEPRSIDVRLVPLPDLQGQDPLLIACLFDITDRLRAEEEQRQKQSLIAAQAAALAERSTPLLPVARGVVVIPLIGSVDAERGQQLMQAALEGASLQRAELLILDITGVTSIDGEAVRSLSRTLRALRLLGVTPIVTGISAQTAQHLVQQDVGLDGVLTLASLHSAISYALRRTGQTL
jgi:anti-anti-sigma regulatory factor